MRMRLRQPKIEYNRSAPKMQSWILAEKQAMARRGPQTPCAA
jgi:hypothetical protein